MESKKRKRDEKKLLHDEELKKKPYRGPKLSKVGTVEQMTGVIQKS